MLATISVVLPMRSTDVSRPLRVAVAMDKYKGCMTATQANEAVAAGLYCKRERLQVACVPMADGGDGTAAVLAAVGFTGTAVDMAACCGVAGYDAATLNPDKVDSSPLGREIMRLYHTGCREITVALGGTRTIDGGAGFLRTLGFTLPDGAGIPLTGTLCGASLRRVASIVVPDGALPRLTMLADVTAPLVGEDGAVRSYGPQKGLSPLRFDDYERGLLHWARLTGADPATAGAAGGMPCAAAALRSYGCHVVCGGEYVAECVADALIKKLGGLPDLWITGEGRSDLQTLQGKAPYALLQAARKRCPEARVALLSGGVTHGAALAGAGFAEVVSINPPDAPLSSCLDPAVASSRLALAARSLSFLF